MTLISSAGGEGTCTIVLVGIHLSKVLIARLKLDKGWRKMPERRGESKQSEEKGKYKEELNEEGQA